MRGTRPCSHNRALTHYEASSESMTKHLSADQQIYFRDLFRNARSVALKDAEGFDATLFAIERFGKFLSGREMVLNGYKADLLKRPKTPLWPRRFRRHGLNSTRRSMISMNNYALLVILPSTTAAVARHITSHAVLISDQSKNFRTPNSADKHRLVMPFQQRDIG